MKFHLVCLIACLTVCISNASSAGVINGSFEDADPFVGWMTTGTVHIVDGSFDLTDGIQGGLLESSDEGGFVGNFTSQDQIEAFLGLSLDALSSIATDVITRGSAIKQEITVSAGDVLSFDWNFLSDESEVSGLWNDFAFWSLTDGTGATLLDEVNNASFTGSDTEFLLETGFSSVSHVFVSGGTFTVGFGVVNVFDDNVRSALLVDNVFLDTSSSSGGVVPEPSSLFVLGALFAPVGLIRRRKV